MHTNITQEEKQYQPCILFCFTGAYIAYKRGIRHTCTACILYIHACVPVYEHVL